MPIEKRKMKVKDPKPKSDKDVKILNLETHLESTQRELKEARGMWRKYEKEYFDLKAKDEKNRRGLVKSLDVIRYLVVEGK